MFKKIILSLSIGLILSCIYISASAIREADNIKLSVLRLHVVANSNSEEDQELKLKVRDEVLKSTNKLFSKARSREQAINAASSEIDKIESVAIKSIQRNNFDYDVHVTVGKQYFPTKEYDGGFRLPAGDYDAVKVTIGEGKGNNWWCVMYPPLCFSGSAKNTNRAKLSDILSSEEIEFVTYPASPQVEFKFKIAEIFGEVANFFKSFGKS